MLQTLYRLLIRLLRPLSIAVGKIYIAPHQRDLVFGEIMSVKQELSIGDVLLTYSRGELTNLLIEGEYKHCAIFVGGNHVVEAIGRGVVRRSVDDFIASKDKVAVARPLFASEAQKIAAVAYVNSRVGSPYDYDFTPGEEAFYCAELVTVAYEYAMEGFSPFTYREILGVKTVLPVDFYNATKKFKITLEVPHAY